MALRILHVTAGTNPALGGVSQAVKSMIKGLSNQEIYNEVVSLDDPNALFLDLLPFHIYALGPGKGPWCYSRRLLPWLTKNLHNYDAVIVHGLWLYHTYAIRKAIRETRNNLPKKQNAKSNFKVFIMPHGMLDPYFQKAPGRKLKALRNLVYWKLLENKSINEADALFFTCEEELSLARQSFQPFAPLKEIVVGLGVEEPPFFEPAMTKAFINKCPNLNGHRYMLFLSRIHEKKGVDLLIKAYSTILAQRGTACDEIPKLVIAGPGLDDEYGERIAKMVNDDNVLKDFIFFPGMLTGDAKWGAFYGCQVFVLPSHQENFGIAIVESLACGKPVLISNKVNIWKEVITGGAGIVAEDSEQGTLDLLERWLKKSTGDKQAMGEHAQKTYKKMFAIDQVSKQLANALQ